MALLQLVRLLASIVAARLFVPADLALEHPWLLWLVGAVVFLGWVIAEQLSIRTPAGLASAFVVLASFAAATVLIHAHSARLTDAATMLLAASGGLAFVAWWRGVDATGAASVGAVFLPAIMIAGYHETFSEVPLPAFILPAVVPLCAGLILVLPETWRRNWRVWIAAAICASVPAITSIILTVRAESLSF